MMQHIILLTIVVASLAFPHYPKVYKYHYKSVNQNQSPVTTLNLQAKSEAVAETVEENNESPKPYNFGFTIDDGNGNTQSRSESGDGSGNVNGGYSFVISDGRQRDVKYTAGAAGFSAKIHTNEHGVDDSQDPADAFFETLGGVVAVSGNSDSADAAAGVDGGSHHLDQITTGDFGVIDNDKANEPGVDVSQYPADSVFEALGGGVVAVSRESESAGSADAGSGVGGGLRSDDQSYTTGDLGIKDIIKTNVPGVDVSEDKADADFEALSGGVVGVGGTSESAGISAAGDDVDDDSVVHDGPPDPYSYSYVVEGTGGGHSRSESRDSNGNVQGDYSLHVDDGRHREVSYTAGDFGLRINVKTNEPGVDVSQDPADVVFEALGGGVVAVNADAGPGVDGGLRRENQFYNVKGNVAEVDVSEDEADADFEALSGGVVGVGGTSESAGISAAGEVDDDDSVVNDGPPDPYSYSYVVEGNGGGHSRSESGDSNGNVQGDYSLHVDDGRHREVSYTAGDFGLRINVKTNEPGVDVSQDPADVVFEALGGGVVAVSADAGPGVDGGLRREDQFYNVRDLGFTDNVKANVAEVDVSEDKADADFEALSGGVVGVGGTSESAGISDAGKNNDDDDAPVDVDGPPDPYSYSYVVEGNGGGHSRSESGDSNGNVIGDYSLHAEDGRRRELSYTAGDFGFRVKVKTNEPGVDVSQDPADAVFEALGEGVVAVSGQSEGTGSADAGASVDALRRRQDESYIPRDFEVNNNANTNVPGVDVSQDPENGVFEALGGGVVGVSGPSESAGVADAGENDDDDAPVVVDGPPDPYSYSYVVEGNGGGHSRSESGDSNGNVIGDYSLHAEDGRRRELSYTAGDFGFRVKVKTNEPGVDVSQDPADAVFEALGGEVVTVSGQSEGTGSAHSGEIVDALRRRQDASYIPRDFGYEDNVNTNVPGVDVSQDPENGVFEALGGGVVGVSETSESAGVADAGENDGDDVPVAVDGPPYPYSYSYVVEGNGGGHSRSESGDSNGNVIGDYSLHADDGRRRELSYTAGDFGFRVKVMTNEPGVDVSQDPADAVFEALGGEVVTVSGQSEGTGSAHLGEIVDALRRRQDASYIPRDFGFEDNVNTNVPGVDVSQDPENGVFEALGGGVVGVSETSESAGVADAGENDGDDVPVAVDGPPYPYSYSYVVEGNGGGHSRSESGDSNGNVIGDYSLHADDGRRRELSYTAGDFGFRVKVKTNEPGVDVSQDPADAVFEALGGEVVTVSGQSEGTGSAHPGEIVDALRRRQDASYIPRDFGFEDNVNTNVPGVDVSQDPENGVFEALGGGVVGVSETSESAGVADAGENDDDDAPVVFDGPPDPYSYSYVVEGNGGGHSRSESGDSNGNVIGDYSLHADDGRRRELSYTAGDFGFRVKVKTNEPGVDVSQDPADAVFEALGEGVVAVSGQSEGTGSADAGASVDALRRRQDESYIPRDFEVNENANTNVPGVDVSQDPENGVFEALGGGVVGVSETSESAGVAYAGENDDDDAPVVVDGPPDPYSYSYVVEGNGGGHSRSESGDSNGNVIGDYSLHVDDGRRRELSYTAGEFGFRVKVKTNEPGVDVSQDPADAVFEALPGTVRQLTTGDGSLPEEDDDERISEEPFITGY